MSIRTAGNTITVHNRQAQAGTCETVAAHCLFRSLLPSKPAVTVTFAPSRCARHPPSSCFFALFLCSLCCFSVARISIICLALRAIPLSTSAQATVVTNAKHLPRTRLTVLIRFRFSFLESATPSLFPCPIPYYGAPPSQLCLVAPFCLAPISFFNFFRHARCSFLTLVAPSHS